MRAKDEGEVIDVVGEAEAIAKAKAFRSRLLECVIESVQLLQRAGAAPAVDSTRKCVGYVAQIPNPEYRQVLTELADTPHKHVKFERREEGDQDALFFPSLGLFVALQR